MLIDARRLRVAVAAVDGQTPLEHVAGDDQRAGDRAVAGDLTVGPDIDQDRAILGGGCRCVRVKPGQAGPGPGEQRVEAQGGHRANCILVGVTPDDPDQRVEDGIEGLIAREHELRQHVEGRGLTGDEQVELRALEVKLDQLWDLLRRRRAIRAAGGDPASATVRDESTVENYRQ